MKLVRLPLSVNYLAIFLSYFHFENYYVYMVLLILKLTDKY